MKAGKFLVRLIFVGVMLTVMIGCSWSEEESKNVDMLSSNGDYMVATRSVNYFEDTEGFLAKPAQLGEHPGVVMIHEWWGLNDNIKRMAEKLAGHGYKVLAVDLYGGEVATESDRARQLSGMVRENPGMAITNMQAAVDYLQTEENVGRLASLGWCFGGQQSLQLSLNSDLDSTVIYYGNLVTDQEQLISVNEPVLGIFGADDQIVSVDSVNQFEQSLNELGVENEIYIYDGVGHAFANPSGDNYAPEETGDAWAKTLQFLEESLAAE